MKGKLKVILEFGGVVLVVALVVIFLQSCRSRAAAKYRQTATPTFFLHGYSSSYRAEQQMTDSAVKAGAASLVVRANVSANGKVTLTGSGWGKKTRNPLIEINLAANRNRNYQTTAVWVHKVILAEEKLHHFKEYNFVAHSMGNTTFMNFILNPKLQAGMPKLAKQVALAGSFNGVLGLNDHVNWNKLLANGRPEHLTDNYRYLITKRQNYPQQAEVLNIYGDLENGSNSDGRVSIASARSLGYLIKNRSKSYHEIKIKGKKAQHSALHNNRQVDRYLINFLWGK
ncbi:alpha/beta hydrolase [Liquorilactobacillus ghanensis]|uniref:alpha/beta hydrolase n=1 Tax=Liquorilactobacillus ghanensis TaxID=399370 RepID=UPI0039E89275